MTSDEYMAVLRRSLRVGPLERRRILRELEAHLVDAVRREEAAGVARPAAERRAIARLGEPGNLAARFSEERGSVRHWSISAGLAAAASIASALVLVFDGTSGLNLLHFNPSCGSHSHSFAKDGRLWTTSRTRDGGSVTCEYSLRASPSYATSISWTETAGASSAMAPAWITTEFP